MVATDCASARLLTYSRSLLLNLNRKSSLLLIFVQVLWTTYLTGCVAQSDTCPAEQKEAWSYRGANGPQSWSIKYPNCNGTQQSPIDIVTADAVSDPNLEKLQLNNYDTPVSSAKIENNGKTVHVEPTDNVARSIQIGQTEYTLSQLHFHWGNVSNRGSEHTIDEVQFTMEMHLVHISSGGDIAVVGVILKQQDDDNEDIEPLISSLQGAEFKDTEAELESPLNLQDLVQQNPITYCRYIGSLTTPPCTENVIWSVAHQHVPVGQKQMDAFRNLKAVSKEDFDSSNGQCYLVNNYRPTQPLNGRTVYRSQ